jgi:hypothetical protein
LSLSCLLCWYFSIIQGSALSLDFSQNEQGKRIGFQISVRTDLSLGL